MARIPLEQPHIAIVSPLSDYQLHRVIVTDANPTLAHNLRNGTAYRGGERRSRGVGPADARRSNTCFSLQPEPVFSSTWELFRSSLRLNFLNISTVRRQETEQCLIGGRSGHVGNVAISSSTNHMFLESHQCSVSQRPWSASVSMTAQSATFPTSHLEMRFNSRSRRLSLAILSCTSLR